MESLFVVKSADGRGRLSDRKVAYSDRIRQNLVPVFALKKTSLLEVFKKSADGRGRTGTRLPSQDFESSTSTNSITSA